MKYKWAERRLAYETTDIRNVAHITAETEMEEKSKGAVYTHVEENAH